uniref:Putative actin-related protein n=1 Tax=uncultured organism TaxID=155900 RepID=A0A0F6PYK3_9ZZZZ|nr:putative actin-related protein [uncultured organism]
MKLLKKAILIESGSGFTKCGYVGEDQPRSVFPTLWGKKKYRSRIDFYTPEDEKYYREQEKRGYIGEEALHLKDSLNFFYPIEKGIITDSEVMEKIWHYAFYTDLRIDPRDHPLLLTEPTLNPRSNKEIMTEVMFETFHVPALYIADESLLSLYASSRTSGCVVDIGKEITTIVPIHNRVPITNEIKKVEFGGKDVSLYLKKLMDQKGTTSGDLEDVRELKESLCYISLDPDKELVLSEKGNNIEKSYLLPDHETIIVGSERFLAPECIFDPSVIGKKSEPLDEMILEVISNCDRDIQQILYKNIVLSGGSTMFPGLKERLIKEIKEKYPKFKDLEIIAPPYRKISSWIGGSILASLKNFQDKWINKREYEDKRKRKGSTSVREVPMDYVAINRKFYMVKDGKLFLQDKNIEDILDIKGLQNLVNLRELDLSKNFKIRKIRGLENIRDLEKLNLQGTSITEIRGLGTLTNLRELNISENNVIREIKGLENLKNLEVLNLSKNSLIEIDGLENLKNLKVLNLSRNSLTEIKGLDVLTNLRILNMRDNRIKEIKGLENLTNLEELFLKRNAVYNFKEDDYIYLNKLELERCDLEPPSHMKEGIEHWKLIDQYLRDIKNLEDVKRLIREIPIDKRAELLYDLGFNAANVKIITKNNFTMEIKEFNDSNIEFGVQIMELALEFSECPSKAFDILPILYASLNRWDDMLKLYEKVIELNILTPMRLTGIIGVAFNLDRQDIIDKFVDLALKNKEFLRNPFSLSNIIYSLNIKETLKASKIALKLIKGYWNIPNKEMIMSLYVNMTYTYVVANEIDSDLDEVVVEVFSIMKKDETYFHPHIFANIAWYYLKKEQINDAIYYLKEAKNKGYLGFMKLKDSKYFRALADNPEFLKLFD